MKTYFYIFAVSVLTAIFLAAHEYSMTKDIQKAKQLLARTLCISTIVTGGIAYYISGTNSLMSEPFDSISSPQAMPQIPPAVVRY